MTKANNYNSGDVYGSVMLTGKSYILNHKKRYVEGICKCGKIFWTQLASLTRGNTKSCGCIRNEKFRIARTTHGLYTHPLYQRLSNMKQRCYNSKKHGYHNYGGRGITVCDEWLNDYEAFIRWSLENGWKEGLTLERKDNDKRYSPDNCKYASRTEQNHNKRDNRFITAFGETKCLMEWDKDARARVRHTTIVRRIVKGWEPEEAIANPRQIRNQYTKNT